MLGLALRHASKHFGPTCALSDVTLEIEPGEVRGLIGQNGSGKSTLIKILSGFHAPEPGASLTVAGVALRFPIKAEALQRAGLHFVHQELGLVPSLTVLENLFLPELAGGPQSRDHRWWVRRSRMRRQASHALAAVGLNIDLASPLRGFSASTNAELAIVRATMQLANRQGSHSDSRRYGCLVLDEPTANLPSHAKSRLFSTIRSVAESGYSVIFVSHHIDEILEVTDKVSVLRDGALLGTRSTGAVSSGQLVTMITGREPERSLDTRVRRGPADRAPAADLPIGSENTLRVDDLTGETAHSLTFTAKGGEIVGLTGLGGTGFEEVPRLLFGAAPAIRGEVSIGRSTYTIARMSPSKAISAGISYVPEKRQSEGGVGAISVGENISVHVITRYVRYRVLRWRRLFGDAGALADQFEVLPSEPYALFRELSGGNQQKALVAKWLRVQPKVLLLSEPTVGVDVGARANIFALLRSAANAGTVVLCASLDYEQLAELCDRVLIFGGGAVTDDVRGGLTKEVVSAAAYEAISKAKSVIQNSPSSSPGF